MPHSCVCFQHVFSVLVVFSKNKQTHGCGLIWHPNNHHRSVHIQHAPSIIIFLLDFFVVSFVFSLFLLSFFLSYYFFFLLFLAFSFFCFLFFFGSRSKVFSFLPLNDVGFDSVVDELQSIQ